MRENLEPASDVSSNNQSTSAGANEIHNLDDVLDDDGLLLHRRPDGSTHAAPDTAVTRELRRRGFADGQFIDAVIQVGTELRTEEVRLQTNRVRVALEGALSRDHSWTTDSERAEAIERARDLLDGYALPEGTLERMSRGQSLVVDQYWALYRRLAEADGADNAFEQA